MNRLKVFKMMDGKCAYCGCELDFENFHIDHIVPKIKGGKDHKNVFPSCPDCNLYKGDLELEQFREKIEKSIFKTIHGRMINKYLKPTNTDVTFYFEELING